MALRKGYHRRTERYAKLHFSVRQKSTELYHTLLQFSKNNVGIIFLYIVFAIFATVLGLYRYANYDDGFDFSVFHQAIWNYAHLHIPVSSVRGLNHVDGDHFHPIIAILAPFYAIAQSGYTLHVLQAVIATSSIFPVYLFSKSRLKSQTLALLAALLYSLSIGLQWMLYFDFHEILFAIPLIAWSIYFIDKKNWKGMLISLALLSITKEELYIYIFSVGILLIVTGWHRKIGAALSILGAGGFVLLNSVIMPILGGKHAYNYWSYTKYGSSLSDAIFQMISNPKHALGLLMSDLREPNAKMTLGLWFKPLFILLPIISPYFILGILLILTRFMSDQGSYSVYTFHYGGVIAPILFMAYVDTLANISMYIKNPPYPTFMHRFSARKLVIKRFLIFSLVTSIILTVAYTYQSHSPIAMLHEKVLANIHKDRKLILNTEVKVRQIVPSDASVMATDQIAAHFANRREIYTLRSFSDWDNSHDKIISTQPIEKVDYIILNTRLKLPDASPEDSDYSYYLNLYNNRLLAKGFELKYKSTNNGWVVYKNINKR